MTTLPVQVERRAGQRFPFLIPVSVRDRSSGIESLGFTQDLSSRGVLFFTDAALHEGAEIELTLKMPSEITLGESMRVRCCGRVLRVVRRSDPGLPEVPVQSETKIAVAVRFDGYEYLPADADSTAPHAIALDHRSLHDFENDAHSENLRAVSLKNS
jgi:hypothetical protein